MITLRNSRFFPILVLLACILYVPNAIAIGLVALISVIGGIASIIGLLYLFRDDVRAFFDKIR